MSNGFSADRDQNALSVYYQPMIGNLAESLRTHISLAQKCPKLEQSIPIVLRHEHAEGIPGQVGGALKENELPVKLSEVKVSTAPLNSTARGALMAALC